MSVTVILTLDDEVGDYLKRIAADQGRTPAEVAAWIVTEDLRRERTIDADLVSRLDEQVTGAGESLSRRQSSPDAMPHKEHVGA